MEQVNVGLLPAVEHIGDTRLHDDRHLRLGSDLTIRRGDNDLITSDDAPLMYIGIDRLM